MGWKDIFQGSLFGPTASIERLLRGGDDDSAASNQPWQPWQPWGAGKLYGTKSSQYPDWMNWKMNTGSLDDLWKMVTNQGFRPGDIAQYNLMDILLGQGKTDPRMFNRQLADISRGTQERQTGTRGMLQEKGLQRSGLGGALETAIGQAGEDRRAKAYAEEAQLAEARKRQDLQLFMDVYMKPLLDQVALMTNQYSGAKAIEAQNRASDQASLMKFLTLMTTMFA